MQDLDRKLLEAFVLNNPELTQLEALLRQKPDHKPC